MKYKLSLAVTFVITNMIAIFTLPVAAQNNITVSMGSDVVYSRVLPDGSYNGFLVDVNAVLCKHASVDCKLTHAPFDTLITNLNTNRIDAILAAMQITPKRAETVLFTQPYMIVPQTFMVLDRKIVLPYNNETIDIDRDPTKLQDFSIKFSDVMRNRILGIQSGTVNMEFITKYLNNSVQYVEYKTTDLALADLLAGRIDVYMNNAITLQTNPIAQQNNMQLVGARLQGGFTGAGYGVAVRKSDVELQSKFNAAIAKAIASGELAEISKRHFGSDYILK